ncbi:MAG TPA: hypothetical protein VN941_05310 [Bradyrhizobium sp.]|nr:hypothetical protein [Bradyrhizobium sp.]
MAGLDPAIHDFLFTKQGVDARHKAGHDEKENKKAGSNPGLFCFPRCHRPPTGRPNGRPMTGSGGTIQYAAASRIDR